MPNWQLADALLYRTYGSVRGALSNGRSYRDDGSEGHARSGQADGEHPQAVQSAKLVIEPAA